LKQSDSNFAACEEELISAHKMLQSEIKKRNDIDSALSTEIRLLTIEVEQLRLENRVLQERVRCEVLFGIKPRAYQESVRLCRCPSL
jgi:hypothetical protein